MSTAVMSQVKPFGNPYLMEYLLATGGKTGDDLLFDFNLDIFTARQKILYKYGFAVPTEEAISAIAALSPIIEIGAGRGYWARLLSEAGAKVVAYDHKVPNKEKHNSYFQAAGTFFPVRYGTVSKLAQHSSKWTLFLCWPPYAESMAYDALKLYSGNTVAFVGESNGCTGDEAFHELLETEWDVVKSVNIPQWVGIHDYLTIYSRKNK